MLKRYSFRLLEIRRDTDPDYWKSFLFADFGQYTEAASGFAAGASVPEVLENLFKHALPSDIVELTDDDGQTSLWYRDRFGFKNLSNTPTEGGTKP